MRLSKVPGFVRRVMWVSLFTSAALMVLNYAIAGIVVALIVFAANLALKREEVKLWVFRTLTGLSREELEKATLADLQRDAGLAGPDGPEAPKAPDTPDDPPR